MCNVCRQKQAKEENLIVFIDVIRTFRIAQIYKLTRHFPGLQLLVETMRASAQELTIWVLSFSMFVIIFATLVYYAER